VNNKYLRVLIYAYSASIFSQGILAPIFAFFVQKIGGGILETVCATSLFSIVTGIVTILIYRTEWSRRYHKECLVWGWLLWLISVLMYCCMDNIKILFLSEVFGALGSALSDTAFDAEYSEVGITNLSGSWAKYEGTTSITSGIASIAGGVIVSYYGFKTLIFCMSFVATISFILILYYSHIKKSHKIQDLCKHTQ